jgi:hypothetical protein
MAARKIPTHCHVGGGFLLKTPQCTTPTVMADEADGPTGKSAVSMAAPADSALRQRRADRRAVRGDEAQAREVVQIAAAADAKHEAQDEAEVTSISSTPAWASP